MRYLLGMVMAGGVLLGQADLAKAQVTFSFGNPNSGGPQVMVGQPNNGASYYGQSNSGYGQPGYVYSQPSYTYSQPRYVYSQPTYANGSGYTNAYQPSYRQGYVTPGTSYYSSGYQGYSNPYGSGYRAAAPVYSNPGNYAPQGYGYPSNGYAAPYYNTGNRDLNRAQAAYGIIRQYGR